MTAEGRASRALIPSASSAMSPVRASPMSPTVNRMSPKAQLPRRMNPVEPGAPKTEMDTPSLLERLRSPPARTMSFCRASPAMDLRNSSQNSSGRSVGAIKSMVKATGLAPMAAMSLIFTARAL